MAVATGSRHTVALLTDGTVRTIGDNRDKQCNVQFWRRTVAITAGSGYTLGLRNDGRVLTADRSEYDQCDVGSWRAIRTPQEQAIRMPQEDAPIRFNLQCPRPFRPT